MRIEESIIKRYQQNYLILSCRIEDIRIVDVNAAENILIKVLNYLP